MRSQLLEATTTLVWIDSEEAIIVRWEDRATVERVRSGIEGRALPAGHHDARSRGGTDAIEQARRERLRRFLDEVATHLPARDDVAVVGPGIVRERLERAIRADDRRHGRERHVRSTPAERLTENELVARVRELGGEEPRRRTE